MNSACVGKASPSGTQKKGDPTTPRGYPAKKGDLKKKPSKRRWGRKKRSGKKWGSWPKGTNGPKWAGGPKNNACGKGPKQRKPGGENAAPDPPQVAMHRPPVHPTMKAAPTSSRLGPGQGRETADKHRDDPA